MHTLGLSLAGGFVWGGDSSVGTLAVWEGWRRSAGIVMVELSGGPASGCFDLGVVGGVHEDKRPIGLIGSCQGRGTVPGQHP